MSISGSAQQVIDITYRSGSDNMIVLEACSSKSSNLGFRRVSDFFLSLLWNTSVI